MPLPSADLSDTAHPYSIGVVHHFNKQADGTLTQRLRGSSAIAGWAEWLIGLETIQDQRHTRKMQFELKAATAPEPLCYVIRDDDCESLTRIERVESLPEKTGGRHWAEEFVQ